MPASSFAGRSGCAPGGTTQRSGSFFAGAWLPLANRSDEPTTAKTIRRTIEDKCFMLRQYRTRRRGATFEIARTTTRSAPNDVARAAQIVAQAVVRAAKGEIV